MDIERIVKTIKQMYPMRRVPLHAPVFKNFEMEYIHTVLKFSDDDFIRQFEDHVKNWTESKYAIATVNGTAALHVALLVAGIKPGDKVITTPLTFVATCNAIKYCGAEPVFVDIDWQTLGMNAEKLEILLSAGEKYSACLPVWTFGHAPRIDKIVDLCMQYGIPVIEDSAQAIGSFYRGHHAGTWGKAGVFSFNWNKTITSCGGGMVITDDKDFADKVRHLVYVAKVDDEWTFSHDELGYNYRMSNLNAAVGDAQMERIHEILGNKRSTAQLYLESIPEMFHEPTFGNSNYWLNTLICDRPEQVNELKEVFKRERIQARPAWELMTKLPMYKDCQRGDLSMAEYLGSRIINLPSGIRW